MTTAKGDKAIGAELAKAAAKKLTLTAAELEAERIRESTGLRVAPASTTPVVPVPTAPVPTAPVAPGDLTRNPGESDRRTC